VVPLRLVAVVVLVQPDQLLGDASADLLVALQVGRRTRALGRQRDLVEVLVRRTQIRIAGPQGDAGEQLTGAGAVHRGEPGPGRVVHGGALRRDLGTRVGFRRTGVDRDRVVE